MNILRHEQLSYFRNNSFTHAFKEHLLYTRLQAEHQRHKMTQAVLVQCQEVHRLQGRQTAGLWQLRDQRYDEECLWHGGGEGFWEEVTSKM